MKTSTSKNIKTMKQRKPRKSKNANLSIQPEQKIALVAWAAKYDVPESAVLSAAINLLCGLRPLDRSADNELLVEVNLRKVLGAPPRGETVMPDKRLDLLELELARQKQESAATFARLTAELAALRKEQRPASNVITHTGDMTGSVGHKIINYAPPHSGGAKKKIVTQSKRAE